MTGSPPHITYATDLLRSELRKLMSLRSTYWTLVAAIACNIAIACLAAVFLPAQLSANEKATVDATRLSLAGLHISQVAIGVLGVLAIANEYGSGMIRTSLTAVPRRGALLGAKVAVLSAVSLVAGLVACLSAYFMFQLLLAKGSGLGSSISDPGVLRAVVGGGLFLAVLGLFGLGLGAATRSSSAAIATLLGALFVPSILIELLPRSWKDAINPYIPMEAGRQVFCVHHDPGSLHPWSGFGVFSLYALAALVVGFITMHERDA